VKMDLFSMVPPCMPLRTTRPMPMRARFDRDGGAGREASC
jgi:hypothetical protein